MPGERFKVAAPEASPVALRIHFGLPLVGELREQGHRPAILDVLGQRASFRDGSKSLLRQFPWHYGGL